MNSFEICVCLIIFVIFLSGCVTEKTVLVDDAKAKLLAFWDKNESLIELFQSMGAIGFHYHNEANDVNWYLDTAPPPEVSQERTWFNCYGAARYFAEFIKYKRNCDSYKMVLMLQRGIAGFVVKWHYVLVIKSGNITFLQSNMELSQIENEHAIEQIFIPQGYQSFQTVEEWKK